jgi:nicotinamide mononucleotide transporter
MATLSWGYVMSRTDAAFPFGDAFTTSASLVAQWLMGRKKLENWVFWIAVDLVAVPIYFSKGLYPTTVMYLIFLGLATSGLISWWKSYAKPAPLAQDA